MYLSKLSMAEKYILNLVLNKGTIMYLSKLSIAEKYTCVK